MSGFEPGSSGGSDNSKWPLWAPRVGPGSTGVFGALVYQGTQDPRLCYQEDIPAQILQRSIKATTRFGARNGGAEREGDCCYPLLPHTLERAKFNNNVLGSMDPNWVFSNS